MKIYTVSYSRYRIGDFEWNTTDKVIATFSTKAQATKFMSICKKTTKNHKTYNFSYYIDLFRLNETDDLKTLLQWKGVFMSEGEIYIVIAFKKHGGDVEKIILETYDTYSDARRLQGRLKQVITDDTTISILGMEN